MILWAGLIICLNNFNEAEKLLQLAYEKSPLRVRGLRSLRLTFFGKITKNFKRAMSGEMQLRLPNIDKERLSNINKKLTYGIQLKFIIYTSPAKINFYLKVIKKLLNGYHEN